jgi:hypothetical protein
MYTDLLLWCVLLTGTEFEGTKDTVFWNIDALLHVREPVFLFFSPCRAVVFVVDSAAFQREVKDVAEFLYQVLIDSLGLKNTPSFLIACNKQGAILFSGSNH